MGDLDPAKIKAAVTQGLSLLEPLIAASKNEAAIDAWNALAGTATKKLLRGEISVDEWESALATFGTTFVQAAPDSRETIAVTVNRVGQIVEEAFTPPSNLTWLIFAGLAATGLAYWWTKKQESEKREIPVMHPNNLLGSRRKAKIPVAEPEEEEEAEFEEIS